MAHQALGLIALHEAIHNSLLACLTWFQTPILHAGTCTASVFSYVAYNVQNQCKQSNIGVCS